jgi:hypothetical protein
MLIKRTAAFVVICRGVTILPGLNRIPSSRVEALEKDEMFQSQIALGNMSIIAENVEAEAIEDAEMNDETLTNAILDMRVSDAIDAVKETLDIDELRKLARADKRVSVQRAVEAQIEKLTEDRADENNENDSE